MAAPFCVLPIKAVPGAPRNEVCGWMGEALKVKVKAPPVEGKANDALLKFLAETLSVPPRAVSLVRGGTSRHKLVRIEGLDPAQARAKLSGRSA